jgi:hypothetical protein
VPHGIYVDVIAGKMCDQKSDNAGSRLRLKAQAENGSHLPRALSLEP